jgi:hypothetical protein
MEASVMKKVALDGKALRHRHGHRWDDSGMAYLVSAFASENGWVMVPVETEGKGQELLGIRQLLQQLQLKGCLVSIDALGCQKDIARKIVEEEGDYGLAVKDNQPTLHRRSSTWANGSGNGRNWRPSPWWKAAVPCWARNPSRPGPGGMTFSRGHCRRPRSSRWCVATGGSRTACMTSWMSATGKTPAGFAGVRPPISRVCDG